MTYSAAGEDKRKRNISIRNGNVRLQTIRIKENCKKTMLRFVGIFYLRSFSFSLTLVSILFDYIAAGDCESPRALQSGRRAYCSEPCKDFSCDDYRRCIASTWFRLSCACSTRTKSYWQWAVFRPSGFVWNATCRRLHAWERIKYKTTELLDRELCNVQQARTSLRINSIIRVRNLTQETFLIENTIQSDK